MSEISVRRPGGVTLVGVLTYISGILDVALGVLLVVAVIAEGTDTGGTPSVVGGYFTAVFSIVVGMVILSVASGILHGSRGARTVIAVVQVISIALNAFVAFTGGSSFSGAIISIIISLVVLGLLYSRRASAFFNAIH